MLEVNDLAIERGGETILDGVNIREEGNPICLLGNNGIGKTSLLLALAGVIPIKKGMIRYSGIDYINAKRKGMISFYVEGFKPYGHLSIDDYYKMFREVYGINVVDLFNIHEWRRTPYSKLSTGTAKKLLLELVLSQPSTVLLIDEPYSNLDKASIITLRTHILKLAEEKIVILTSPSRELVEDSCVAYYDVSQWSTRLGGGGK